MSGFDRAYDDVLMRWPLKSDAVELVGRFGTTRLNVCGSVDAPPIILLAGGGATSTVWLGNVAALAAHRRVVAVDTIGDVGRSTNSGDRMKSLDDLIEWLDEIVEYCAAPTVAVMGHSYGAMIALAYTLNRPGRVSKLVLLDPNSCFCGMKPAYLLRAVPILLAPNRARAQRFLDWEAGGLPVDDGWREVYESGYDVRPKPKLVVPKRPSRNQLRSLGAELLVVVAGQGRVHDPHKLSAAVRAEVPRATVVQLDHASHHSLPTAPADELNAAVGSFLRDR